MYTGFNTKRTKVTEIKHSIKLSWPIIETVLYKHDDGSIKSIMHTLCNNHGNSFSINGYDLRYAMRRLNYLW